MDDNWTDNESISTKMEELLNGYASYWFQFAVPEIMAGKNCVILQVMGLMEKLRTTLISEKL